jgi:hypothetical protein
MNKHVLFLYAAAGFVLGSGRVAQAAPIVPGQDTVPSVAVQMIELSPGTPFNPTSSPIDFQLTADGSFTMTRDLQSGTTINISAITALFKGNLPPFLGNAPFDLVAGTPDLHPITGQITNVTQNPADPGYSTGAESSFTSGDFTANTYFKLDSFFGTIYSDPNSPAVFTASLTSLPPAPGTVFSSPDRVKLYYETGSSPDPTHDPVIGYSFDRTVTATPEPTSLTLLGLGAVSLAGYGWRRRQFCVTAVSSRG